jgi:hypothetical protein
VPVSVGEPGAVWELDPVLQAAQITVRLPTAIQRLTAATNRSLHSIPGGSGCADARHALGLTQRRLRGAQLGGSNKHSGGDFCHGNDSPLSNDCDLPVQWTSWHRSARSGVAHVWTGNKRHLDGGRPSPDRSEIGREVGAGGIA